MAHTKSAVTVYDSASSLTTHPFNFTLGAGTSRKITVIVVGEPGGAWTINSATFDANAMTERTARQHASDSTVKGKVYTYDVADGMGTGTKEITFVLSASADNMSAYAWQTTGSATGVPEYATYTEASNAVAAVSDAAVAVTTNAIILAAFMCGSGTPTFTWSGSVTESAENDEAAYTSGSADSGSNTSGTKTVTATGSGSSGYKLLFVVSIAEAAASGPQTIRPATIIKSQRATMSGS